jgi:O-acetyl-ADP-ribose deacetylase (regulator of RNase III)
MGSGIAKLIRYNFPSAYEADCKTVCGDRKKLGTFSSTVITHSSTFVVVNAYTQYNYGGSKIHADYDAIQKVFRLIKASFTGLRIGYPKIGAGLAGGDWDLIKNLIENELVDEDHTLVQLK